MKLALSITVSAIVALAAEASTNNIVALAMIESGYDMRAKGKHGERSAWQIRPATWNQYSKPGERITREADAFAVASRIYTHNAIRFNGAIGRLPNAYETYAMWNLGWDGFKRRGFNLARCPRVTRDAAMRYANLWEDMYARN